MIEANDLENGLIVNEALNTQEQRDFERERLNRRQADQSGQVSYGIYQLPQQNVSVVIFRFKSNDPRQQDQFFVQMIPTTAKKNVDLLARQALGVAGAGKGAVPYMNADQMMRTVGQLVKGHTAQMPAHKVQGLPLHTPRPR